MIRFEAEIFWAIKISKIPGIIEPKNDPGLFPPPPVVAKMIGMATAPMNPMRARKIASMDFILDFVSMIAPKIMIEKVSLVNFFRDNFDGFIFDAVHLDSRQYCLFKLNDEFRSGCMMFAIRPAELQDANALLTMYQTSFHDTFAKHNRPEDMAAYMSEEIRLDRVVADIVDASGVCLIAIRSGAIVGFARLMVDPVPEFVTVTNPIRLSKLYVATDVIGKGVGKRLMQAGIDWASANGCHGLWLGVWEHNHRAIEFYNRRGFKIVGNEEFKLGGDIQNDFVMQLELTNQTSS